jgi:hypothetical protein
MSILMKMNSPRLGRISVAAVAAPTHGPRRRVDDRQVGREAHQLIQRLLDEDNRSPSNQEILAAAAAVGKGLPPTTRAHLRARCAVAAAGYFDRFVLDQPWQVEGAEICLGASRLDLLWRHPDGRLLADELKTGRLLQPLWQRDALEQAARHASGGERRWGAQFLGVRLLWTQAPERSLLVRANGHTQTLDKDLWR